MLMIVGIGIGFYSGWTMWNQFSAGMSPDTFAVLACVAGLALAWREWSE